MSETEQVYLEWGPALPASYGEDAIVAMVRDPDCLVFYWDVSTENAGAPLVARVRCVSRETYYDIDLPRFRKPWHLPAESNLDYRCELLARREGGRLELLASSATVCLPVRHAWQAHEEPVELRQAKTRAKAMAQGARGQRPADRPAFDRPIPVRVPPPEKLKAPPTLSGRHYVEFDKDD